MKITLIITTYNLPEALELCLLSVLNQTKIADEVIIADDGSNDETRKLIVNMTSFFPVKVIHSWHEDKGFRAAKSRNEAIVKATGDYIVLVDGDIIMERHFIDDHMVNARPNHFIQGSRVILSESKTKEVIKTGDISLFFFSNGIENRKNSIRALLLSKIFSKHKNDLDGIRACNYSFWRNDALAVNGFNEDFIGWGREDSEFASRLMNKNIHRFNLKFMATAFHLYHPMCTREHLDHNNKILEHTIENKSNWCRNGTDKYI